MIRRLMEFLAPPECVGCGGASELLCAGCVAAVPTPEPHCFGCERLTSAGECCPRCLEAAPLAGVTVAARYEGVVKRLVLTLKFDRQRSAAVTLGDMLVSRLPPLAIDAVTCVPVAPARRRERGYNQSELLARRVAQRLGRPYVAALGRTGLRHQIGLGRGERLRQVRGVFFPTRRLTGQRLLLVDDVFTTGATAAECARVLHAAGADWVWAGVVAKHLSNGDEHVILT